MTVDQFQRLIDAVQALEPRERWEDWLVPVLSALLGGVLGIVGVAVGDRIRRRGDKRDHQESELRSQRQSIAIRMIQWAGPLAEHGGGRPKAGAGALFDELSDSFGPLTDGREELVRAQVGEFVEAWGVLSDPARDASEAVLAIREETHTMLYDWVDKRITPYKAAARLRELSARVRGAAGPAS